ncbi:MAG: hypothetical protein ABI233_02400 [Chthoniobacterales bacterium]
MSATAEVDAPARPAFSFDGAVGALRDNPLVVVAGLILLATLVYFFGFVNFFGDRVNGPRSTAVWAWKVWDNPVTNYEHAKLIPFLVLFLLWSSRAELKAAPIGFVRPTIGPGEWKIALG